MVRAAPCLTCRHFWLDESRRGREAVCAAFPQGIPDRILEGLDRHETPHPGDHGIQYEVRPEFADKPATSRLR